MSTHSRQKYLYTYILIIPYYGIETWSVMVGNLYSLEYDGKVDVWSIFESHDAYLVSVQSFGYSECG